MPDHKSQAIILANRNSYSSSLHACLQAGDYPLHHGNFTAIEAVGLATGEATGEEPAPHDVPGSGVATTTEFGPVNSGTPAAIGPPKIGVPESNSGSLAALQAHLAAHVPHAYYAATLSSKALTYVWQLLQASWCPTTVSSANLQTWQSQLLIVVSPRLRRMYSRATRACNGFYSCRGKFMCMVPPVFC